MPITINVEKAKQTTKIRVNSEIQHARFHNESTQELENLYASIDQMTTLEELKQVVTTLENYHTT